MTKTDDIFIGKGDRSVYLALKLANRHGLISGATGTGKTVTLQILAEEFSRAGVPVFLADVKGDLAGLAAPAKMSIALQERANTVGISPYEGEAFPVCFWDLFGQKGHPARTTIIEMGSVLLSRLLQLNDTQEGVLTLAFRLADDENLLLLDLKDLQSLLRTINYRRKELSAQYGNVATASINAIQRKLLAFEEQGAAKFFGEPALEIKDLMRTDENGRGIINILAADKLMMNPKLYSTFLLWLLSELFEDLPEIGDPEKPVFVFFFDEAHLIFDGAPKALVDKIEQVVRLIRSKGVGVYFVTQNPLDVPDDVSSQLGARVQHSLRAFTPKEQKVIKAVAETFRPNPKFTAVTAITQLGIGEALVSTLLKKGTPSIVERTLIRPPASRMGPLKKSERLVIMGASALAEKYTTRNDRRSAYEILSERRAAALEHQSEEKAKTAKTTAKREQTSKRKYRSSRRQTTTEAVMKQAARTATSQIVRAVMRGILGNLRR